MFLLVEFNDQKELAVIPDNWKDGTSCALWPPFKSSSKVVKAVMNKDPPLDSWQAYPIRVMYSSELYEKARTKLKQAEVESDLQTENEEAGENGRHIRSKRATTRYSSSDEEDAAPVKKRPSTSNVNVTEPLSTTGCQAAINPAPLPTPPARLITQAASQSSQDSSAGAQTPPSSKSFTSLGRLITPAEKASQSGQNSSARASTTPLYKSPTSIRDLITPAEKTNQSSQNSSARAPTPPSYKSPIGTIRAKDIQLFTLIESIREEQRHQNLMLSLILTKLGEGTVDEDMPDGIHFPLKTIEEMTSFEEQLGNANVEKLVINQLTSIGGSSVRNMGARILKHAVANPLADQYNWTGSKSKLKFGHLKITSILKRAIRRTFREVTDADIQEICRIFLKSARDRDGGRKRRMSPVTPDSTPIPSSPDVESDSDGSSD